MAESQTRHGEPLGISAAGVRFPLVLWPRTFARLRQLIGNVPIVVELRGAMSVLCSRTHRIGISVICRTHRVRIRAETPSMVVGEQRIGVPPGRAWPGLQRYVLPVTESVARRLFQLVEPVAVVTYMADEPTDAVMALGLPTVWDAYFAGRAAPLGRDAPAALVHALFYNFADGEVARHIPHVWHMVTPEAANAARQQGSVAALRRILGDLADAPGVARAADLLIKAGTSAPTEGRALYASVRTLPLPTEPVARLWHGANLLREHRGDGHVAALLTAGVGGTEAHVLHALSENTPAEKFGRVSHLPGAQLAAVVDGMRARGLIGADGWLTAAGRQTKDRVESVTDELATPAYDGLDPSELDQLVDDLEPLAAVLVAAGSQ
jgi:helix-turn-helix protein